MSISRQNMNRLIEHVDILMRATQGLPTYMHTSMMNLLSGNSPASIQMLNSFADAMESKGVSDASLSAGIHANDLADIVWHGWLNTTMFKVYESMNQQNRAPAGFGSQTPQQQYGGIVNTVGTRDLYDVIPATVQTPVQAPAFFQNQPSENVQQHFTPTVEALNVPSDFLSRESDEYISFDRKPSEAYERLSYRTGEINGKRFTASKFHLRRTAATALDSHGVLRRLLHPDYVRGHWAQLVTGNTLVHFPMGTETYLTIVERVGKVDTGRWEDMLEEIGRTLMADWNILNRVLITQLKNKFHTRLRMKGGAAIVDNLNDLLDLRDTDSIKVSKHTEYRHVVNSIITQTFETFFNKSSVIKADDNHFGDFISSPDVLYYDNGFTERDYGVYPENTERQKNIAKLLEKNTVLRVPTAYLATNVISDQEDYRTQTSALYLRDDQSSHLAALLRAFRGTELKQVDTIINYKRYNATQALFKTYYFSEDLDGLPVLCDPDIEKYNRK